VVFPSPLSSAIAVAFVPIAGLATATLAANNTADDGLRVGFVEGAYDDESTADGQKYRLLESEAEISVHLDPNAPTCLHMTLFAPKGTHSKQMVEVLGPDGVLARVDLGETTLASPTSAYIDLSRFVSDPVRLELESESRVVFPGDPRDVSFGIILPVRAVDEANCTASSRESPGR
jgi:hypothetical protein